MSDGEMFDEDVNDEVEDDDDEHDVFIKQELISFVKVNPALCAKNWKECAGKNFCKDLAWENIGSSLSRQMSGKNAAKMWYNIRQRFDRERRKVSAALKGKSGRGAKPLYMPTWPFYNLCLFLVDHIMPRKTVSNYTSNKIMKKTTTIGKAFPIFILPSPSTSSSALSSRSTPSPQAPSSQTQSQASILLSPQAPSSQTQSQASMFLSSQALSPQASVLLSPASVWSTTDFEFSSK